MSQSLVEFCSATSISKHWQRSSTQHLQGWVNMMVTFFGVCGPKFMKFCGSIENPSQFPTPFPIVYVMFRAKDIRH